MFPLATVLLLLVANDVVKSKECVVKQYAEVQSALEQCTNVIIDNITVPSGHELTLDVKDGGTVTFRNHISFEQHFWYGPLVKISGSNFNIKGEPGSVLDGNGQMYWDGLGNWGATVKPKFVKIHAKNATMKDVKIRNCPVVCVMIRGSENVTISNWFLDVLEGDEGVAPPNKFGHNTDGFTIGGTKNLLLNDSKVFNQDDCVAITSGKNITVSNMLCHGSHGLSIKGGGHVLEDVLITNSIVTNAENGIHVKTPLGSPPGLIKNITYNNITMLDCKNYGINIQQNYQSLPAGEPMVQPPENKIKIYELNFINVFGSVQNGAVPVYILCADQGCFNWVWDGVEILGSQRNNCTGYLPKGYSC